MKTITNTKNSGATYGVVGTLANIRLERGGKLHVGDLVKIENRYSGSTYQGLVVQDVDGKFGLWGFLHKSKTNWHDFKSQYRVKKLKTYDKVTGLEKFFSEFNIKAV